MFVVIVVVFCKNQDLRKSKGAELSRGMWKDGSVQSLSNKQTEKSLPELG